MPDCSCRFSDWQCREVINLCSGARLGYVCDVEAEVPEGRISVVSTPEEQLEIIFG